jgi:hypothetical protein
MNLIRCGSTRRLRRPALLFVLSIPLLNQLPCDASLAMKDSDHLDVLSRDPIELDPRAHGPRPNVATEAGPLAPCAGKLSYVGKRLLQTSDDPLGHRC